MHRHFRDDLWAWIAMAATATVAVGVRKGPDTGWKRVRKEDPPEDPAARGVRWGDALLCAGVAGMLAGLARVAAPRGVSAAKAHRR